MRLKREHTAAATFTMPEAHFNEMVQLIAGVEKKSGSRIKVYTAKTSTLRWYIETHFKQFYATINTNAGELVIDCVNDGNQANLYELLTGIRNHGTLSDLQRITLGTNSIIPVRINTSASTTGGGTSLAEIIVGSGAGSASSEKSTAGTSGNYTTYIIIAVAAIIIGIIIFKKRK